MKTPRTKKDMIEYLRNHFRYDTMDSWNAATSYARNVKLNRLDFPSVESKDRAYDLLNTEEAMDDVNWVLQNFAEEHDHQWQIGFNGRSSGYLVLYQGGRKPSQHKSWCSACGQWNCDPATDENKKCGRCGADARVNRERFETFTYPGKGLDMGEDFEDWGMDALRSRVKLVMEFDHACEDAVQAFIGFCENHKAEEQVIHVPKKILVASPL